MEGVPQPRTNTVGINTKKITAEKRTQDFIRTEAQLVQTRSPTSVGCGFGCRKKKRGTNTDFPYRSAEAQVYTDTPSVCPHLICGSGARKQTITKTTVPLDDYEAGRVDVYYFDHGNSG